MPPTVRRRLFQRVTFWDPASGTILDLSTRYVLSNGGPSESEEYARTTSGSKRPVSRSHSVQVPVTERETAHVGRTLQRFACPFKAFFFGPSETDAWAWLEPTRLQVRDPNIESGLQAERVLDLESDVFYPSIWEGTGLISGVPWRGTTQQTRNGNKVLRPEGNARPGYKGPLWSVPSGSSVDMSGSPSGIDSQNTATLEFEFPVWGATVKLDNPTGSLTGTLQPLDWNGASLKPASQELVVPEKTWSLLATVENTGRVPDVYVEGVGQPYGVQEGEVSPDCSRVNSPLWNETDLVLTGENI